MVFNHQSMGGGGLNCFKDRPTFVKKTTTFGTTHPDP